METNITILDAINLWFRNVEKQLEEIENNPEKISEVIQLKIVDVKLSESHLEDIQYHLEGFYESCDLPVLEEFDDRGFHFVKQVNFDRFFDETFEYEDNDLVIATGFKFEYLRKDDDYSEPYEIDESTYNSYREESEDENTGYYRHLRKCGWSAESDIK